LFNGDVHLIVTHKLAFSIRGQSMECSSNTSAEQAAQPGSKQGA
jgi:hypothetical protein